MRSFLLDTTDFLSKISGFGTFNSPIFLCTMDVVSLYTSIPHAEGIAVIRNTFIKMDLSPPLSEFLLELLSMVLTRNFFCFEEVFYQQQRGTAMGSNVAPSYANLFMDWFEQSFVYPHPMYLGHALCWLRYIDDIFFIWSGTEDSLLQFKNDLDGFFPTISFTLEHSRTDVHFLDVLVKSQDGVLQTSPYRKPTDRNTYLSARSYHPQRLKKGLPYGQFLRLRRISSDDSSFYKEAGTMYEHFLERGYDPVHLDRALQRAAKRDRSSLLQFNPRQDTSRLPMVLTYSPLSLQAQKIVRKHWHILGSDPTLPTAFREQPICAFKRSNNLRDALVHARSTIPPAERGFHLINHLDTAIGH
ncbi:uncharacterized protein [Hyperolius riggenbachi]